MIICHFFIYDGDTLKDNDERRIKNLTNSYNFGITVYKLNFEKKGLGHILNGNVTVKIKKGEKEENINYEIEIGTLESTFRLYEVIENRLVTDKKIKKLYLNNKEINMENEKSLLSLGIKEDFNVIAELKIY